MFRNNETFAREDFITYYSNIVAQRYVYAALDKLLPVSNGVLLRALYLLNELLVSAAALLFLLWLEKHTVPGMALFGAVMLGLFGMVYDAMAANLYWVEWSMFAPPRWRWPSCWKAAALPRMLTRKSDCTRYSGRPLRAAPSSSSCILSSSLRP